jgi:hypothetical protein
MIRLNSNVLKNAIERSRKEAKNLLVRRDEGLRRYLVTNRDKNRTYSVAFDLSGKLKYGMCDCVAGRNHKPCKHLAAAAALHVWRAQQNLIHLPFRLTA